MKIDKNDITQMELINTVQNSSQVCHARFQSFKLVTGLRSHLISHLEVH